MNLVVDGIDESGAFMGDGENPPFVVFDVNAQENIAGPFNTRDEAEYHIGEILMGRKPQLNKKALIDWLNRIDSQE